MKLGELKDTLDRILKLHPDYAENEIIVKLAMPSVGPIASVGVTGAQPGIDWDRGNLILYPEKEISIKTDNEKIYDMAKDLMMWIATKPTKNKSYEQRTALSIFERMKYDVMKYQHIFHRDVEKKKE